MAPRCYQGSALPGVDAVTDRVQNQRSLYRVVFGNAWKDASSRRALGSTFVLPTTVADNRCSAKNLGCTTYTYGVNL